MFMKKSLFVLSLVVAIAIAAPLGTNADHTGLHTIEQIRAQIAALQAKLAALLKKQETPQAWCHTFNKNLKLGESNSEVSALKTALRLQGFEIEDSFADDIWLFDEKVASAVVGFQQKYRDEVLKPAGLVYGTGFVGRLTRNKLNALYGCARLVPPPPPQAPISVQVTSPNGGEVYKPGDYMLVKWASKNLPASGYMSIQLQEVLEEKDQYGNTLYKGIGSISQGQSTLNDGQESWMIPKDIKGGSRFVVAISGCVRDMSASEGARCSGYDYSDAMFTIATASFVPPPPPPSEQISIQVTSPNGGETFVKGSAHPISFLVKGYSKGSVTLQLYSGAKDNNTGTYIRDIVKDYYGGSPYTWQVPADLAEGTYKIYAVLNGSFTTPKEVYDFSDAAFTVTGAQKNVEVKVLLSAAQPAATLAVRGAVVPFTNITISPESPVIFKKLVVERTGVASDQALSEIVLIANASAGVEAKNNDRVVAYGKIDAITHKAVLTPIAGFGTINGLAEFTVAGVMASDLSNHAGQTAYLTVTGASFVAAGGYGANVLKENLPIQGTAQTVNNSLAIGELSIKRVDDITTGERMDFRATLAEDLRLYKIALRKSGGSVLIEGVSYSCAALDSYEICDLGNGITIPKGTAIKIIPTSADFIVPSPLDITVYGKTHSYRLMPVIVSDLGSTQHSNLASVLAGFRAQLELLSKALQSLAPNR